MQSGGRIHSQDSFSVHWVCERIICVGGRYINTPAQGLQGSERSPSKHRPSLTAAACSMHRYGNYASAYLTPPSLTTLSTTWKEKAFLMAVHPPYSADLSPGFLSVPSNEVAVEGEAGC